MRNLFSLFRSNKNVDCSEKIRKCMLSNLNSEMASNLEGILQRTLQVKNNEELTIPEPTYYTSFYLGSFCRSAYVYVYVFFDYDKTPMMSLVYPSKLLETKCARKDYIKKYCFKVEDVLPLMVDIITTLTNKKTISEKHKENCKKIDEFIAGEK